MMDKHLTQTTPPSNKDVVGNEVLEAAHSTKIVDCGNAFATEEIFSTRRDLINWAENVGKNHGFVVISRYYPGVRRFVIFGCERGGRHKTYKNSLEPQFQVKCECPFELRGNPLKNGEGWKLTILCRYHNHERSEVLVGHASASQLSGKEKSLPAVVKNEVLEVAHSTQLVDCRLAFFTKQIFATREDLINWAQNVGKNLGFVVVVLEPRRKTFVTLGCERGGKESKHRTYKNPFKPQASEQTGNKKCECPFKLTGDSLGKGEGWKLKIILGFHNHEGSEALVGHAAASQLSGNEKSLPAVTTKNMVKPRSILPTLKDPGEGNNSTIKTIFNAHHPYRRSQRGPGMKTKHLMKLLENDKYMYWYRKVEKSDTVKDIFWTCEDAIKLLNTFPNVLIIDSSYNTNRYPLPLLEIVGVTSTDLTFSVAFAYLEPERTDNFTWALQKLKGLFLKDDAIPEVIVTDRDIALLNAVNEVFPSSSHLLCQFHINKNVEAKCKLLVSRKVMCDLVLGAWENIVASPNEDEFDKRVSNFEDVCGDFPIFIEYVKNTWLIHHKEKIVSAWIDKVMHLGNTTTNRAAGAHGKLKKLLQDSKGDLCRDWDRLNILVVQHHIDIQMSFQRNMTVVLEPRFGNHIFSELRRFISGSAISHIIDEYGRVRNVGVDTSACGCKVRRTHGLPCACELTRVIMTWSFIKLDTIHPYWKKLSLVDLEKNETWLALSFKYLGEVLFRRFEKFDVCGKIALKRKLREFAFSNTILTCPPPGKDKTRGAFEGNTFEDDGSSWITYKRSRGKDKGKMENCNEPKGPNTGHLA